MRAFITGITGFAGSHLAEHLLAAGDEVWGSSRAGRWANDAPLGLRPVPVFAMDVGDASSVMSNRDELERRQPDVLFHLAGLSIPAECGTTEPTALAQQVNVDGTRHVLQLAASLSHPPRVVYVSSSHVYSPALRDSPPVHEQTPLAPRGGYGLTKAAAEAVCREFHGRHGLDVVVARAFSHAGPRQDERLMLSSWCRQFVIESDKPIEVLTLDAAIDLSDVRDVVRAYRLLALHGLSGRAYNVGSGIRRTSGEVLAILRQLADPKRDVVELRPGARFDPIADILQLQADTGWQPAIPIEDTVADALAAWRRSNSGSA